MNKAKLIWTTWRRTSVAKRDEYCVSKKNLRVINFVIANKIFACVSQ